MAKVLRYLGVEACVLFLNDSFTLFLIHMAEDSSRMRLIPAKGDGMEPWRRK